MNTQRILLLSAALVLGGSASCVETYAVSTPGHCANEDGDATCVALDPTKPYCDGCGSAKLGCVAAQPTTDECYYACGGERSVAEDDSCLVIGEDGDGDGDGDGDDDEDGDGDGDGDDDTGDGDGDGDQPCQGPQDCPEPNAPLCDPGSGQCVPCEDDAACVGLSDTTPVCDGGTCVACSEHEQCPQSACNMAEGNCFDVAGVVHVDGDGDCEDADGSESAPYCTINEALLNTEGDAVILLHAVGSGAGKYDESITILGPVAILAVGEKSPKVQGIEGDAAIKVGAAGRLFMRGVTIANTVGKGMSVLGMAWVENSRIVENDEGDIHVAGGTLVLENSFVGGDVNNAAALEISGGSASVVYTTLASGHDGAAAALTCNEESTVTVRNSLLVSLDTDLAEVQCPVAMMTNNALEIGKAGNTPLGPMNPNWFKGYNNGDLHLGPMPHEAIEDAAKWIIGDPTTDIDGDPRPQTNGSPDFAGADRIP